MQSLTYGVLPNGADLAAAFDSLDDGYRVNLNPSDCDLLDWAGATVETHGTWDFDDVWEVLARLTNLWAEGDPYAGESAGNLASSILETLGFEWI